MWQKLKESKRALSLYIGALMLAILLVLAMLINKLVPGSVEAGVQMELAKSLGQLLVLGVPVLMAGISYTDSMEVKHDRQQAE